MQCDITLTRGETPENLLPMVDAFSAGTLTVYFPWGDKDYLPALAVRGFQKVVGGIGGVVDHDGLACTCYRKVLP